MQQLERRDPEELLADEDEDVDMDDDEEQEDGEGEDDESSSSSEGNEDDDEEDEGDEEADLELRRKIEEALRVNGISAATGDSDDESEEDLDEGVRRGRERVCMYIAMKYILFAAIHVCSESESVDVVARVRSRVAVRRGGDAMRASRRQDLGSACGCAGRLLPCANSDLAWAHEIARCMSCQGNNYGLCENNGGYLALEGTMGTMGRRGGTRTRTRTLGWQENSGNSHSGTQLLRTVLQRTPRERRPQRHHCAAGRHFADLGRLF